MKVNVPSVAGPCLMQMKLLNHRRTKITSTVYKIYLKLTPRINAFTVHSIVADNESTICRNALHDLTESIDV